MPSSIQLTSSSINKGSYEQRPPCQKNQSSERLSNCRSSFGYRCHWLNSPLIMCRCPRKPHQQSHHSWSHFRNINSNCCKTLNCVLCFGYQERRQSVLPHDFPSFHNRTNIPNETPIVETPRVIIFMFPMRSRLFVAFQVFLLFLTAADMTIVWSKESSGSPKNTLGTETLKGTCRVRHETSRVLKCTEHLLGFARRSRQMHNRSRECRDTKKRSRQVVVTLGDEQTRSHSSATFSLWHVHLSRGQRYPWSMARRSIVLRDGDILPFDSRALNPRFIVEVVHPVFECDSIFLFCDNKWTCRKSQPSTRQTITTTKWSVECGVRSE